MKKIIALLLVLVMAFGLIACGNNNANTDETKGTEATKGDEKIKIAFVPKVEGQA